MEKVKIKLTPFNAIAISTLLHMHCKDVPEEFKRAIKAYDKALRMTEDQRDEAHAINEVNTLLKKYT